MQGQKSVRGNVTGREKVPEVAAGKAFTSVTRAFRVKRALIKFMLLVFDVETSLGCEDGSSSGVAGRHDAIKHIDA